jgi:uncharacterized protein (TIGR03083 family)
MGTRGNQSSVGKAAFLDRIRSARQALNEAISGLSEEELTAEGAVGDWSVKDVLAHLAAWQGEAALAVERAARGEEVGALITESVDEWNQRRVEERRRLPLVDVVQEFNETHDRLLAKLEEWPSDTAPLGPNGWDDSARLWWLTEHDGEHLDALKAYSLKAYQARQGRGSGMGPD